jgi:hypothetical protein
VIVTLVGYPWAPELLSNTIYLLTWALIGLAILGAFIGREGCRREWLGVALFGGGYLILHLVAGPVNLSSQSDYRPTHHLVDVLRPWLISGVKVLHGHSHIRDDTNAHIVKMLEKPIPMKFPGGTPLIAVLKYIQRANRGPYGNGIPIINSNLIPIIDDPMGMQSAGMTEMSPVVLDLEGVPLRTILRLALKQVGRCFIVRNGGLIITSDAFEQDSDGVWDPDDPCGLIGHCLLAWLAAGVGGLLATLVAYTRREGSPAPA